MMDVHISYHEVAIRSNDNRNETIPGREDKEDDHSEEARWLRPSSFLYLVHICLYLYLYMFVNRKMQKNRCNVPGGGGGEVVQKLDHGCKDVCKAVGDDQTVHPSLLLSTNHNECCDVDNGGCDADLDAGVQVTSIFCLVDGSAADCHQGLLIITKEHCACNHPPFASKTLPE